MYAANIILAADIILLLNLSSRRDLVSGFTIDVACFFFFSVLGNGVQQLQ